MTTQYKNILHSTNRNPQHGKAINSHQFSGFFITDAGSSAAQHFQYLPFGEIFINQTSASWAATHTFLGKEKCPETGLDYFGARYYSSGLSVWLSVDALAGKYPDISPFIYCASNPIILIDPDGNDGRITFIENENGSGGTIKIESTIHVYGRNAKIAVKNANKKFKELKNNPTIVEMDGKRYNVEIDVNYVYSSELDKLGKDINKLTDKEINSIEGFKDGDNILQIGVPKGGGETGIVGLSGVGDKVASSYSEAPVDLIHESLHSLGLFDTYKGSSTPKKGFEKDIMTLGVERGQEINQHHFSELTFMACYLLSEGKKEFSKGFRSPNFTKSATNPNQYNIIYNGVNPQYIRNKIKKR